MTDADLLSTASNSDIDRWLVIPDVGTKRKAYGELNISVATSAACSNHTVGYLLSDLHTAVPAAAAFMMHEMQ